MTPLRAASRSWPPPPPEPASAPASPREKRSGKALPTPYSSVPEFGARAGAGGRKRQRSQDEREGPHRFPEPHSHAPGGGNGCGLAPAVHATARDALGRGARGDGSESGGGGGRGGRRLSELQAARGSAPLRLARAPVGLRSLFISRVGRLQDNEGSWRMRKKRGSYAGKSTHDSYHLPAESPPPLPALAPGSRSYGNARKGRRPGCRFALAVLIETIPFKM